MEAGYSLNVSEDEEEPQYPPGYEFEDLYESPTSSHEQPQCPQISPQNIDDSDDDAEPLPGVYFYPDDEDDVDDMIMLEGYGDSEEVTEVVEEKFEGFYDDYVNNVFDEHSGQTSFYCESCHVEDSVNQVQENSSEAECEGSMRWAEDTQFPDSYSEKLESKKRNFPGNSSAVCDRPQKARKYDQERTLSALVALSEQIRTSLQGENTNLGSYS